MHRKIALAGSRGLRCLAARAVGGQEVSQLPGAAGGREPSRMLHLIISSFVPVFAVVWDHTQVS